MLTCQIPPEHTAALPSIVPTWTSLPRSISLLPVTAFFTLMYRVWPTQTPMPSPTPVDRKKLRSVASIPAFSAKYAAVCHPNPAGKILEMATSPVTVIRRPITLAWVSSKVLSLSAVGLNESSFRERLSLILRRSSLCTDQK